MHPRRIEGEQDETLGTDNGGRLQRFLFAFELTSFAYPRRKSDVTMKRKEETRAFPILNDENARAHDYEAFVVDGFANSVGFKSLN